MALRIVVGAFLASVVMFLWGFIFWVILSAKLGVMHPADEAVVKALQDSKPESGAYFYPMSKGGNATDEEKKDLLDKQQSGPLIQITYRTDGFQMDPRYFAIGFGQFFASALLAAFLLAAAAKSLPHYTGRVVFVFMLGLVAATSIDLSFVVWFNQPWQYPAMLAGYHVTNWLLGGLVLAAVVRAPHEA